MIKRLAHLGLLVFTFFTWPANAVGISDLLISEIMANPAALSDSEGEWFELYNPTNRNIILQDSWLGDDGNDLHRFDTDLLILPGEYLTLARGSRPGFDPGYVYSNFTLANGGDEILLGDTSGELLRFTYAAGFVPNGQSMELFAPGLGVSGYRPTPEDRRFAAGDIGTPGAPGSFNLPSAAVPEPSALWLVVAGLAMLARRGLLPSDSSESFENRTGAGIEFYAGTRQRVPA